MSKVPSYLEGYEDRYREDPKGAALAWFRSAGYGLFMHFGVYSLLGRGEWVMLNDRIPMGEYTKLADAFTAEDFDACEITDLAVDAGMRYVNLTTRHHDGFCLFRTAETEFNSLRAACGRDLVSELAVECGEKGLGLFLYYSYGLDWRHPYYFPRESGWEYARPDYPNPEPSYLFREDGDFAKYIEYANSQIRELLTQYGPVAGMWFDPIMPYYHRPDLFPVRETYSLVRSLQPQCLVSFKQGATGDEDFASCERQPRSLEDRLSGRAAQVARMAWCRNRDKHNEICDTLQPQAWGYRADGMAHRTEGEVREMLDRANSHNCNLLLNTGPLPSGAIDEGDAELLRSIGSRLRTGWEG